MATPKARILICGGTDFKDHALFNHTMEQVKPYLAPRYCIINGAATGADKLAREWATFRGVPLINMPANWHYYDKGAGPVRNGWMLEFCFPDLVIALPGNSGTKDMMKQARAKGVDVYEVKRLQIPGL